MSANDPNGRPVAVDVAIPCYQYGRFLRDCVTSVLTQGIRDLRVLIIDNASTDNSLEVAQQLAAEDRRVEVVAHRRNLGHHASFNEAVDWAGSKYFMVLCADDLLAAGSLARAVAIMERRSDVVFAYGRAALLRPHDPMPVFDSGLRDPPWRIVAGGDLIKRFCRTGVCHIRGCATTVVRTVAQKLAGYYRAELPDSDDFELWMRLARLGPAAETDAVQGIMRDHGSSISNIARRVQNHHERGRVPFDLWRDKAAFESFFAHEGSLLPEAERLRRLAKRSLGGRAYWSALAHLCRGQVGISRDLLKFAFRLCPTTAILPPLSYLLRRDDAGRRIVGVASEMVGWPHAPARPAPGWWDA